ncbi:MAG: hypothetical protein KF915_07755 [Polyangiaceae bacterium]|nr:hypothetical protein [Polyangiaceae bacterium]
MARADALGCSALFALPAALALTVAAGVYGTAAFGRGARPPPPPPGADVIEGRMLGPAERPPLGGDAAYAELGVECMEGTGRDTVRTVLTTRTYGAPRITTPSGQEHTLPPFSSDRWSGYRFTHEAHHSLRGHPAGALAPGWETRRCDQLTVSLVSVPPGQHVIIQGERAWFGSREELASRADQGRTAFRDRALLLGGIAAALWGLAWAGGRRFRRQRRDDDGER